MDIKDAYNLIAEDWHNDHLTDDWWVEGTEAFLRTLPPHGSILDVGCAGGVKSRYLIDKGFQVTGIDIAEKFIDIAKREVPEGKFYIGDVRDLSTVPGTFDGIFAQASLLHLTRVEIKDAIAGFVPKLTPNGAVYITVKKIRDGGPQEETRVEERYGGGYERFFSYYTPEEIEALVTGAGFKVVYSKVHNTGPTQWVQVVGTMGE